PLRPILLPIDYQCMELANGDAKVHRPHLYQGDFTGHRSIRLSEQTHTIRRAILASCRLDQHRKGPSLSHDSHVHEPKLSLTTPPAGSSRTTAWPVVRVRTRHSLFM